MKNKNLRIVTRKGSINLSEKDYIAAGGQAAIYSKNGYAFKIYHDRKNMIPVEKIKELNDLNKDNILKPIEPIYEPTDKKPIGFVMKHVKDTEFLCKIFTKAFRKDNSISPQDIADLVRQMQKTLIYIHSKKVLVVDYNEMNFMLGFSPFTVFHIDVDSWKTPHFPPTALMESVRDRSAKKGKFTELTDWFSFAVVTFQMYVGIHPYKGFHPNFSPRDWGIRMEKNISVFDPDVELPPSCQSFSVIPKKHLEWYKEIFIHGDRSIPPFADKLTISAIRGKTIKSKDQFEIEILYEFKNTIKDIFTFDNLFVVTYDGIYRRKDNVFKFKESIEKANIKLCAVPNEPPLIAFEGKDCVQFLNFKREVVSEISAEAMMSANQIIYTVDNGELIENRFEKLGKLKHITESVSSICPSYKIFKGVIVQDDFMRCQLVIPYYPGECANIHILELDGSRILDAKYEKYTCVLISEKSGKYFRNTIQFNTNFFGYSIRTEPVISLHAANFVSLVNGIKVMVDDEKVTVFKDLYAQKKITGSPFDVSMKLYHDGMSVLFLNDNKIYSVKMK